MMSDESAMRRILSALRDAGFPPKAVDYGDGESIKVKSVAEAVSEVMEVDEAYVIVGDIVQGWVRFVLGQGDPLDLVADHTVNLSDVIDPIMRGWGL